MSESIRDALENLRRRALQQISEAEMFLAQFDQLVARAAGTQAYELSVNGNGQHSATTGSLL